MGVDAKQTQSPSLEEMGGGSDAAVREWRREQFLRVGFQDFQATLLAYCDTVDLGRVRELTRRGCSLDLVLRIVL